MNVYILGDHSTRSTGSVASMTCLFCIWDNGTEVFMTLGGSSGFSGPKLLLVGPPSKRRFWTVAWTQVSWLSSSSTRLVSFSGLFSCRTISVGSLIGVLLGCRDHRCSFCFLLCLLFPLFLIFFLILGVLRICPGWGCCFWVNECRCWCLLSLFGTGKQLQFQPPRSLKLESKPINQWFSFWCRQFAHLDTSQVI